MLLRLIVPLVPLAVPLATVAPAISRSTHATLPDGFVTVMTAAPGSNSRSELVLVVAPADPRYDNDASDARPAKARVRSARYRVPFMTSPYR